MTRHRSIFFLLAFAILSGPARAADKAACLECHSDKTLTKEEQGRTISLFVDERLFSASVHKDLECVDCHQDADVKEFPHEENLKPVACGQCHDDVQVDFDASIHGQALKRNAPYAPTCSVCHGTHDILSPKNPKSSVYKMNVPYLCGECHREGAPVARVYEIGEHNIIENYSESIHGEGLYKKGLIVTAACADCHSAHLVLPHTDPRASTSVGHIASTCMKCHSRIEDVHEKVIRGELWEKAPGAIPACTDCHVPHKARKESVALTISDRDCLKCHDKPGLFKIAGADTISLTVHRSTIDQSAHENIPCVKCHSDIDPRLHRPCETARQVDCSNCHAKVSEEYAESGHGQARARGVTQAPYCTTCHGDHNVKDHRDESSPVYRASVPALCGDCHRSEGKASLTADLSQKSALTDYSTSVHGRGLIEKGLLPSAVCIDCHGSHLILGRRDNRSTVYSANIPATCASCHRGIYKEFIKSVHYNGKPGKNERLPNCADCHSPHTISDVKEDAFVTEVTHQCGSCHERLSETYFDTMHGKAYRLGYLKAAKCSDCHGAHEILSVNDPNSSVGLKHIVTTCQKCHDDANMRFTGYLTHATHHDPAKYPFLFYTYWGMTFLLLGVFTFFGLHTLMWLPRSFKELKERKKHARADPSPYYIRRFTLPQRLTHLFVIVSFMSLALTGMTLKFSGMPWAHALADFLGGVRTAGVIHRIAAVITFGYFIFHLASLVRLKRTRRIAWRELLLGDNSLMFTRKDLGDFFGTLKWFFGLGPRPSYGRWTYWEKFDYLAVFWGVAVIGLSGLMLWFPELFTKFLPGALINVATIIHSDEALLAVGFIFTVHFFNTHLRPEAFPMDTVVFTGLVRLDEYKKDRPAEYERLMKDRELRKLVVKTRISRRREIAIRIFGYTFLAIGVTLIGLIIYSVLYGYK